MQSQCTKKDYTGAHTEIGNRTHVMLTLADQQLRPSRGHQATSFAFLAFNVPTTGALGGRNKLLQEK